MWVRRPRVGGANDFAEKLKRRIIEPELVHNGIEADALAMMPEFGAGDIEHRSVHLAPVRVGWQEHKLGFTIYEPANEPGSGHSVNNDSFSRYPAHVATLFGFPDLEIVEVCHAVGLRPQAGPAC